MSPNHFILVASYNDLSKGELDVLHSVGYPDEPTKEDVNSLMNELLTDPEFSHILVRRPLALLKCSNGMLIEPLKTFFDGLQKNHEQES